MCHGLVDRDIEVTVRCAYPYYPEWKDKSGRNGFRIERTKEKGLTIERYGLFIPWNPNSVWQRVLYEGSYFLSICRSLIGDGDFDAVIVFCPLVANVAFGGLHKLFYRRPLLLNVQDLPADAAAATGIAQNGLLKKVFKWIQKALFNRADVWRSISPVMIEQLKGVRGHDQPLVLIPDWLHPTMAKNIKQLPSKVGRAAAQPPRLFYSGNIGTKQGLLDFCKILQTSSTPFDFLIRGEGGGAAQVRNWIASTGDSRFTYGPLVDESEFVRALHDADLFVITEKPGKGASFFPSKSIPAMASGTPILAVSSSDSPLGCEVQNQGIGPWFSWERCGEIGELLGSLDSRSDQLISWQKNALQRSLFYERENCLDLFQQTLEEMLQGRTGMEVTRLATEAAIS